MNSFNSMKNGSSIVNPRTLFKIIQVFNDIYVLGSYRDVLKMYNTNDTEFSSSMTFTTGYTGIFIAKYNNSGMGIWLSRISGVDIGIEYPVNMVLDSSSNIYILGSYNQELILYDSDGNQSIPSLMNTVGNAVFLAKYNSDGYGIWATKITMNNEISLLNNVEFTLTNVGEKWSEITSIENKNWSSVAISSSGLYQTAVIDGGNIYVSSNYGVNWSEITSIETKYWGSVSISSDGKYQTAVIIGGDIYTSSNYGVNWSGIPDTGKYWRSVSMSSDGKYQTAVINGGTIFTSSNYGNDWVEITTAGNKNWYSISVSSSGLFQTAVVNNGTISTSSNYGINWTERNAIIGNKSWFSVSISSSGVYQTAVINNGTIYTTSNYGINWTERNATIGNKAWTSVSISYTGQFQIATIANEIIYISTNYGTNWVQRTSAGNKNWSSVAISSTGVYQTAVAYGTTINTSIATTKSSTYTTIQPVNLSLDSMNNIYISGKYSANITLYNSTYIANPTFLTLNNVFFGNYTFLAKYDRDGSGLWAIRNSNVENNWIGKDQSRQWSGIAISSNGQYQTATVLGGFIYISSDFGNTWSQKASNTSWFGVAMSSDGQYQTATETYGSGYIYVSTDTGNTWSAKDTTRNWSSVAMSWSGQYQTAPIDGGQIYVSTNFGNTWAAKDTTRSWKSVAMSWSGQYQTALASNDYIYVSTDNGNTWSPKDSIRNWGKVAMSSTGQYQSAYMTNGLMYISTDTGNTWVGKGVNVAYNGLAISYDGQYQIAVSNFFHYVSIDYGNTWSSYYVPTQRHGVAVSSNGQYQTAIVRGNKIHILSRTLNSNNLLLDTSNNLYVSGTYSTEIILYSTNNSIFTKITGGPQTFISKYNSDGSGIWILPITRVDNQIPLIVFDSSKNMYISGTYANSNITLYNSTYMTNPNFKSLTLSGSIDTFIAKYTSDGSGLWATRISSIKDENPVNLVLDSGNNVYISGSYNASLILYNGRDTGNVSSFTSLTNTGNINTFIAKYNTDGSGLWATQFGTDHNIVTTFGNNWVNVTSIGRKNFFSIAISSDGKYQTAIVPSYSFHVSSDYGTTWTNWLQARNWSSISISSDGRYQTLVSRPPSSVIWRTTNYGNQWVNVTPTSIDWISVAISFDGRYQIAAPKDSTGSIWISSSYGANWVSTAGTRNWRGVTISSSGMYQTAVVEYGDYIYRSTNYGVNWSQLTTPGRKEWSAVSMSSSGMYQTAVINNGTIYISSNYGVNWSENTTTGNQYWTAISVSSSGQYQSASAGHPSASFPTIGDIYVSTDYGNNWTGKAPSTRWYSIAMSYDGTYQVAAIPDSTGVQGAIYSSISTKLLSEVKPVNLLVDSVNNLYISGTNNTPFTFTFYNSNYVNNSTFKTLSNSGNTDTFIAKYNSDGSGVWATRIGDSSFNNPVNLVLDLANDVYISGTYGSQLTLYNSKDTGISTTFKTLANSGGSNTFITKYNKYGTGIWATRIAGTNSSSNYINNLMLSK